MQSNYRAAIDKMLTLALASVCQSAITQTTTYRDNAMIQIQRNEAMSRAIERAKNILIRGATSSIGFAAISMSRAAGLEVTATTRSAAKAAELHAAGATHVMVDDGTLADKARTIYPDG